MSTTNPTWTEPDANPCLRDERPATNHLSPGTAFSTACHTKYSDVLLSVILIIAIGEMSRLAQSIQCRATGWTTGRSRFDPRRKRKDFSCSLCIPTGFGARPASCTVGTRGPFPGTKWRPWRDADLSPPSSAEVENE
jgi:hypothetical protein